MIIAVFRSRIRPEAAEPYHAWVAHMEEIARSMPGYISDKTFASEDGEQVSVHEWESAEALRAWSEHPEHAKAQTLGCEAFYDEYTLYVSEAPRESRFKRTSE